MLGHSTSRDIVVRPPRKPLSEAGILHLAGDMNAHGQARATVDIARAAARAGARSVLASSGGELVAEARIGGVEHAEIAQPTANPFKSVSLSRHLARLIAAHEIDILHICDPRFAGPALKAARKAGIVTVATLAEPPARGGWLNSLTGRGIGAVDHVIAISDFAARRLRTAGIGSDERTTVIPRGIDLARFNPAAVKAQRLIGLARRYALPDDMKTVLAVGRVAPHNGYDLLVEALAKLNRDDVYCLILGAEDDSGHARRIEQKIEAAGLGGRVRLGGRCEDMPAAYMLADLVVCPTATPKAFGRACAEAQAMGRPVIATDHGAAGETVTPQTTGWLFPPDHAGALAEAIDRSLLLDADARRAMALATRAHVTEAFALDRMCQQTLALYETLLARA